MCRESKKQEIGDARTGQSGYVVCKSSHANQNEGGSDDEMPDMPGNRF